jgi:hypothetical protein
MTCRWLFTIMNEQKKAELRSSETVENNDIEEVIQELE